MLKKEFYDVLKQSIYFCLAVTSMTGFLLVTKIVSDSSYYSLFFPIFQFASLFFAMFLGITIFSLERGQGGMEYLLSLPYSRLRLLGLKVLPRICAVVFFYLIFWILFHNGGYDLSAMSLFSFSIHYFSIFIIALSFAGVSENFLVLTVSTNFAFFALMFIQIFIYYLAAASKYKLESVSFDLHEFFTMELGIIGSWPYPLVAAILLLPFLISKILAFKKFDIRPARVYNRRFFRYLVPLLSVGIIISFFLARTTDTWEYHTYYLTSNHNLIETDLLDVKIHNKDRTNTIFQSSSLVSLWNSFEVDDYFIFLGSTREKGKSNKGIFRVHLETHKLDTLNIIPSNRTLGYNFKHYGNDVVFLEKGGDPTEIVLSITDVLTLQTTKKSFKDPILSGYLMLGIIGTGIEKNNRFWLVSSYRPKRFPLLRLWENGQVESLGLTASYPKWINRKILVSLQDETQILEIVQNELKEIHKIPGKLPHFPYISLGQIDMTLDEIYYKTANHMIMQLDLQKWEAFETGEIRGSIKFVPPDLFYYTTVTDTFKLYFLKDGKIHFIKESPQRLQVFPSGIIQIDQKDRVTKVYSLPDLKELPFKGL